MSVVSPRSNGAHESLQGVYTYDAANFYSLFGAVSRARAGRRTTRRPQGNDAPILGDILRGALPVLPPNPPLVSMVVPTFNRRKELTRNLQAFSKQTYPNFEVIVVNDCGAPVEDIVARFPFARLVTTPQNSGCARAINYGFSQARGEYLGALADDDLQYPDHIRQLVSALDTSRLDVVHSDIVLRLETQIGDGRYATYGHLLVHDNDHDPVAAYWGGACTHAAGYLASRKAWAKVNYFNPEVLRASDIDSVLRFSKDFDFGHVAGVTGEMSFRDDGTNSSAAAGRKLAYEVNDVMRAHAPNRRLIQDRLGASVQGIAEAQERPSFFLPWIRISQPIPVE
jgi:glycosyltransferase involved in cell wall biosynthesis